MTFTAPFLAKEDEALCEIARHPFACTEYRPSCDEELREWVRVAELLGAASQSASADVGRPGVPNARRRLATARVAAHDADAIKRKLEDYTRSRTTQMTLPETMDSYGDARRRKSGIPPASSGANFYYAANASLGRAGSNSRRSDNARLATGLLERLWQLHPTQAAAMAALLDINKAEQSVRYKSKAALLTEAEIVRLLSGRFHVGAAGGRCASRDVSPHALFGTRYPTLPPAGGADHLVR